MGNPLTIRWTDLNWRRKALRLSGFDYSDPSYVYFVTICAQHLRQPFSEPSLANRVIESILFLSNRGEWRLYAFCLMPDHLHLALSPVPDGGSIPHLIQRFKSYTTRLAWKHDHNSTLWQRSYYDHVARRKEDVAAFCQYILLNPIRKGLADDPGRWPYYGMPHPLPG